MNIDKKLLDHLIAFDTPTICNALELAIPERRGSGFTTVPLVCAFQQMKPIIGVARTATIRAMHPSDKSAEEQKNTRLGYYEYVASDGSLPTITVIQDLDPNPGFGAFWGEVNTAVHKGLGVAGCITNGSIRDLDMIATDFQLLAGMICPSHAYVRVEEYDIPVSVHGMDVTPGQLLHADRHGAVIVPIEVIEKLPAALELCTRKEAPILQAARESGFTVDKLKAAMGQAADIH